MLGRVHRGGNNRHFCHTPVDGGPSVCPDEFELINVVFEIDARKLEIARERDILNTHAYAVGELVDRGSLANTLDFTEFKYVEPHSGRFELTDGRQITGTEIAVFKNVPFPVALAAGPVFYEQGDPTRVCDGARD